MKKLIIFDVYGTLISTGTGSIDAVKRILALQEKAIDETQFYIKWKHVHKVHCTKANSTVFATEEEIFRNDLKELYQEYGISREWNEDVQIMLDSLYNRKAFSEVAETIDSLRKNFRIVLGSTTDTEPLLYNLKYNNIRVDNIYTSEIIKKYKPDPCFYKYILEHERVAPKETIFVGDSIEDDVIGPQAVGIQAVLVNRKEEKKGDYIIRDLRELYRIVEI